MELRQVLEVLLFSAQRPLTAAELQSFLPAAVEHSDAEVVRALKRTKLTEVEAALEALAQEYAGRDHSYRLVCVAEAWQFASLPEFAPWLKALAGEKVRPPRMSQPALETLTIIAYRQPITRAELEQIRGVSVDGVMQTLLERGLVESAGRAEVVGRPMTYTTTKLFLEYFGLRSLDDLPAADELRRIPVERPPSLVTTEPGLATVPPEQLTLDALRTAAAAADSVPLEPTEQGPDAPASAGAEPEPDPGASSTGASPTNQG